jgi:hypothetical protein
MHGSAPARGFLVAGLVLGFLFLFCHPAAAQYSDDDFLDGVERDTFLFFLEKTDERGFTIESTAWPTGSTASSGFYLTSLPVAVERGWISYDEGYDRALNCLNSYYDDQGDPGDFYVQSEHGFFPHWFDRDTGRWNGVDCFSSIDQALFLSGALTVRQYFSGTPVETRATQLYEQTDWQWMMNGGDTLSMGWRPDTGFLPARWTGYNEGMLAVLLAMGSPTHPVPAQSWDAWTRSYEPVTLVHGSQNFSFVKSNSPALFTYQYPQVWFDLKGMKDRRGIDYFENSVTATLENRAYCTENPGNQTGYGPDIWGLTSSECPLHGSSYGAHGPDPSIDDGTVAPSGAGGSILFTPDESIEALRAMTDRYEKELYGRYGFRDAFNPAIDWTSPTYIGIDQGVTLGMIENHRTGLIHNLFMANGEAQTAMRMAGFPLVYTQKPHIAVITANDRRISARIVDPGGIESAVARIDLHLWEDEGGPERSRRGFVHTNGAHVDVPMVSDGTRYTAVVPLVNNPQYPSQVVAAFTIEARNRNGAISTASYDLLNGHNRFTSFLPLTPSVPPRLPAGAPAGSLLIENFDGCVSIHEAGAWQGGPSASPRDSLMMYTSWQDHDSRGCSMKIRYTVEKPGAYNGIFIKLDHLNLTRYKDSGYLVFSVKGNTTDGYPENFVVKLEDEKNRLEYRVSGVTGSWSETAIPLKEFRTWTSGDINWTDVRTLTIVLENPELKTKNGTFYLDDIYLSPGMPEHPEGKSPPSVTKKSPGFDGVAVILLIFLGLVMKR